MTEDERNNLIEKFARETYLSAEEIARRFNLKGTEVRLIIRSRGLSPKQLQKERDDRRIKVIRSIIESEPDITNKELYRRLGVSHRKLTDLLKSAGIKRDLKRILTRSNAKKARRGRIVLTKDLLTRLYVEEEKSIIEISKETGYSKVTIYLNFQRFKIKRRKKNPSNLTPREAEVLALMEKVTKDKEIANLLGIGLPSVRTYVLNIYRKLGVHNRGDAILKAKEILKTPK